VYSFVPQPAQDIVKNAVFRKPAFTATTTTPHQASPLDNLPDALRQVSLPSPDGLLKGMVAFLDKSSEALTASFQSLLSTLQKALETVDLPTGILQEFADKMNSALAAFVASHPELQPLYNGIQQQFQKLSLQDVPSSVVIAVSALVSYSVISSLLTLNQEPPPLQPYPQGKYNATSARAYFDDHFLDVIQRGLEVATNSLGFGLSLLSDYVKYVI
jgi:hypothetical protein